MLGLRAHPAVALDAVAHRQLEVLDQVFHFHLGDRREVFLDIGLPDQFAERAVDERDRALPAGLVLGHAAERAGVFEAAVDHRLVEIGRGLIGDVELLPQLKGFERSHGIERRQPLHGRILVDDDAFLRRDPGAGEIGVPIDARRIGLELVGRIGIVDLLDLAPVGRIPAERGDFGFEGHDLRGGRGGIGRADRLQSPRDVVEIGLALGRELRIEVIILLRQADPALAHPQHVHRRIVGVGIDREVDQVDAELPVGAAHEAGELALVLDGLHFGEIARQRLQPELFGALFIHERVVQGAVLAARGRAGDQLLQLAAHFLAEIDERAGGRPVRRDLRRVDPLAGGIALEIVARLNALVARGKVDAEIADRGVAGDDDLVGWRRILRDGRCGHSGQQRERRRRAKQGLDPDHVKEVPVRRIECARPGRNW